MVKYEWEKITGSYDLMCTDKKNTCKRALCECDLDYAKKVGSNYLDSFLLTGNNQAFNMSINMTK